MILEKIFIFILFLGPLVFFHELGHFFFARLFGVRVETFSLGFGPKLFQFKYGDTQYAVSLIPLGGYVKMFGDDPINKDEVPESERAHAFTHKSKFARFWIVFGGPLANFILAYFIYFSLLISGEKVPEPKIGYIPENSKSYELGLRTADVIVKINDKDFLSFDDFNLIDSHIETIRVSRANEIVDLKVNLPAETFVKEMMTFPLQFRAPIFVDAESNAYVMTNEPQKINWENSIEEYAKFQNQEFYLYHLNIDDKNSDNPYQVSYESETSIKVKNNLLQTFHKEGYYPIDLMVGSIVDKSPAESAKLQKDDVIVALNGKTLTGFNQLKEIIQNLKVEESVKISYRRKGQKLDSVLKPEVRNIDGQEMKAIGVYSAVRPSQIKMINSKPKSFIDSLILSYIRTAEGIEKTLLGFKRLITAEASLQNIGGPVAIAKVAADSLNVSISYFFRLMAIISINLGIINLFPIPVLDGGHIVFLVLEMINRGPLSKRKMEIAQQFGVSLLFILIAVALYNDFSRIF